MKFTGIISAILLSVYSVSAFVGIGMVHCRCTQSQRLVMMPAQPSCQSCHSSKSCCRHENEQSGKNCRKGCCSLVYKHVEVDQLSNTQLHNVSAKVLSLPFSHLPAVDDWMAIIKENAAIRINSPPPRLIKIPLIYMHSQLRL